MKECCETGGPRKKRYWHWVVLGVVVLLAFALQMIPIRCGFIDTSNKAQADMSAIVRALDEYAINNSGRFPSTLQPLVMPDTNGNAYLEGFNGRIPVDPWKREYLYEPPTPEHPEPHVWSFGADGKLGGTGDDADIDSEQLREPER
ncbi:MAG TPA: type II secretion system protein GspG [Myxococcota bacterium]|nr:type II secretion system protein GspG [Myxococcota bacterium]